MNKKVFFSHSHQDKELAEKLSKRLRLNGVDVWLDKWEILPGDSLVQKIFVEGLSECEYFLVLISEHSANSKWVQEELNAAVVQAINGICKIIPLVSNAAYIPLPLQGRLWINLSKDEDTIVRDLTKAIFEVSEKPSLGVVPTFVTEMKQSVGGLTQEGSTLGQFFIHQANLGFLDKMYEAEELHEQLSNVFTIKDFCNAVEELERFGLVEVIRTLGTVTYTFKYVEGTYALYLHFKDQGLQYEPLQDIYAVAAAAEAKGQLNGEQLKEICKIPAERINHAIRYLDDYNFVNVRRFLGTAPYTFGIVSSNGRTREFIRNQK